MQKTHKQKQLRDGYRFPGFTPSLSVSGLFGDPKARVITLTRRSKKRPVASAGACNAAGTTESDGSCAILPAAMRGFISTSSGAGSIAGVVAP